MSADLKARADYHRRRMLRTHDHIRARQRRRDPIGLIGICEMESDPWIVLGGEG